MGSRAVELLKDGIGNRVIGMENNKIHDIDIVEGLEKPVKVREDLIELLRILSI